MTSGDNEVFAVRCPGYEPAGNKVSELLSLMGGIGAFAGPGEKIALKVNLLRPAKPEEAVTTHPSVVAAVARLVAEAGAAAVIADSPGSGYRYDRKTLEKTYRMSGMEKAAAESGAQLNFDTGSRSVSFPEGMLIKRFEVLSPVLDADGVFNICKMKTHLFMHMTGAVKNNFGVIPGLSKPGYHAKLHNTEHFANMLLDLAQYVRPRVSIMDAVIAMEGEGPGAGKPREVGLLLCARNPLALDVVAGEIMGIDRKTNPLLVAAEKRGMYPNRIEDVRIIGPQLAELAVPDFKLPSTIFKGRGFGHLTVGQKILSFLIMGSLSARPEISRAKCTGCGSCSEACPVKAIAMTGGEKNRKYACIDRKACIRCYCCHEMCRVDAVDLRSNLLHRILTRNNSKN